MWYKHTMVTAKVVMAQKHYWTRQWRWLVAARRVPSTKAPLPLLLPQLPARILAPGSQLQVRVMLVSRPQIVELYINVRFGH
jgi:hypothetical protein